MGSHPKWASVGTGAAGAALIAGAWQLAGARRRLALGWSPSSAVELVAGLHVRRLGTSGPVLLLLHGLTASGRFWGGGYDALAGECQLVIPDLLGFGGSPRPATGYRADDHADAVLDCLERLGLGDAPLVIGAHSFGTLVALRLAVRRGEQVRAIVAFSPPLYRDRAGALAAMAGLGPMARLSAVREGAAHATCKWACAHRHAAAALAVVLTPGLPRPIALDSVAHTWPSFSETLEAILAAESSDWLDHITAPIHLVAGSRDPVVDRSYLAELATTRANISLEDWSGQGHLLPLGSSKAASAMFDDRLHHAI